MLSNSRAPAGGRHGAPEGKSRVPPSRAGRHSWLQGQHRLSPRVTEQEGSWPHWAAGHQGCFQRWHRGHDGDTSVPPRLKPPRPYPSRHHHRVTSTGLAGAGPPALGAGLSLVPVDLDLPSLFYQHPARGWHSVTACPGHRQVPLSSRCPRPPFPHWVTLASPQPRGMPCQLGFSLKRRAGSGQPDPPREGRA